MMMNPQVPGSQMLYVSHVEQHGPFIKVWGQVEKQVALHIEKALKDLSPRFDVGQGTPSLQEIKPGLLCCAKYNDGNYYRAQIRNVSSIMQYNMVEVQFLDYGNRDMVATAGLRTTDAFLPGFLSIPPQAREYILANVTHQGQTWDFNVLGTVMKIIRYRELQYVVVSHIDQCILVKLYLNGEDVAQSLFNQGTVLSIATIAQQLQLQQLAQGQLLAPPPMSPKTPVQVVQQQVLETAPLPSFKSVTLEPGSQHSVYVAYVSDGPLLFSVQLVKIESTLHRLMQSLSLMPLKPLDVDPIPGTVCVARCKEDDHICRAVVSSMTDNQFKVYYVDFGNSEVVPFSSLYTIPPEFVIPKVMAMRYALAGLDRSNVTIEMKVAFKRYVQDRPLLMKVHQLPEGRSYIPLCDLFGEDGVSALDVVISAATASYPQPLQLSRGFTQEVTVNYVQTCSRFFVQLTAKSDKLNAVMEELQNSCPSAAPLQLSELKPGLPCCALFQTDGQWYRAEILSIEDKSVQVRYVDYGNEETVDVSDLRRPVAEQITCLFPQALECCLNGYQNMPDDEQRDILFEELTLEKTFAMKVVEMLGNKALVEVIDSNKESVSSALVSKIAAFNAAANPVVVPETLSPLPPASANFENRNKPKFQDSKPWGANNNDDGEQNNWRQRKPRSQRENDFESGGFRSDRIKSHKQQQNNTWGGNKSRRKRSEDGEWGESSVTDRMQQKRNNTFSKDGFNRNQNRRNNAEVRHDNENWGDDSKYENKSKFGRSGGFRKDGGSDGDWKKDRGGDCDWKKDRSGDGDWKKDRGGDDRRQFNRDKTDGGGFGGRERRRHDFNQSDAAPWKTPARPIKQVTDPAPSDAQFGVLELTELCLRVTISWFYNPGSFYCQVIDNKKQLDDMMNDIADSYEGIEPGAAAAGAPAIALFAEDQSIYRVRVLAAVGSQYRVKFVDFGNIALTDKVWPIESRFMELPAQAVHCALSLIPAGEAWGDTDRYFGDGEFVCQFVSKQPEDGTYTIGLWYGDKNIGESLVADGLARYSGGYDSLPALELSLLVAQQMWVTLGEVAALDNFVVTLGSHSLVCAMHNLLEATEKKEEVLKAAVGTIVIMYVDNVLEDKLEVTLYDNTGTKLEIIEPDEGSYPTVDPLCPFPVTSSTISGYVSHVTETTLFIQPSEHADAIEQLLEKVFSRYNGSVVEAPIEPVVGSTYAALAPDTNWYRAQVTEVDGETVTVLYVDYGNSEEVAVANLRELTGDVLEMHVLALEVTVADIDKNVLDQMVTATVWYGDAGWEARLELPTEAVATETAAATETAVATEATAAQLSAEVSEPQTDTTYQQPLESCVSTDTTTGQVGVSVVLTHTDSPAEFYVQWSEELDTINNLHALLQEQAPEFADLENPTAGMICAAPYSVDEEWYRAQILDADADITTVRYIDYGNTDVVDNASTAVKTLPPELLAIEPHACRCSLKVQCTDGSGGEWSSDSITRFEELTNVDALTVEILHKDEKSTYVNLRAGACNVGETLVSENLAAALELETQSSCTGYICNINSPSEFWIQLENSVADLEWIAEQLSDAHKFADLDDLTPGSLCAALFPEDQMWYRARILSNTVAGLEVLFIDYGNSCNCSGLKQLPEEIIMLPGLAQKCTLQKPNGILQWSSQANKKFNDIAEDGACVFSINRLGTGETVVVQLFRNGADISLELAPETVPVQISHFESIDNFWLQKLEDVDKLDELAGKMGGASDWSDCLADHRDKLVGAVFDQGSAFRRASVLEARDGGEYDVLFVDYGNSATSHVIKELPESLGELPAFACKCKLEPVLGYSWTAHSSQEFEALQSENFTAEFEPDGVVILYINQVDVRSRLSSISASPFNSPKKTKSLSKEPSQAREVDEVATVVTTEQKVTDLNTESAGLSQNETNSELVVQQSAEIVEREETSREEVEVLKQEVFEAPSQIVTDSDEQKEPSKSEIFTTEIPERITGSSEVKEDNQISSPTKDKAILESEIDNFQSGENEVVDHQLVEEVSESGGKHLDDKIEDIETANAQEEVTVSTENKDEATAQKVAEIEEKEEGTKEENATEIEEKEEGTKEEKVTEVNTKAVDQHDDDAKKQPGKN